MALSFPGMFSLEGRTAVVTGGTRGIGEQMAVALAEAGSDIILIQVRRGQKKSDRFTESTSLTDNNDSETRRM